MILELEKLLFKDGTESDKSLINVLSSQPFLTAFEMFYINKKLFFKGVTKLSRN